MFLYIALLLHGLGGLYFLFYFVNPYDYCKEWLNRYEKNTEEIKTKEKTEEPYETKYMSKYKNASREIVLTEEEKLFQKEKEEEFLEDTEKKIIMMNQRLLYYEKEGLQDTDGLLEKIDILKEEREKEWPNQIKQTILEKRREKLKNAIIVDKTPLGNVVMFYDNKKETFSYYSDNTIPYRYLETVARKYVTTFQCKYIYIDMEEELEESQKKQDEKREKEKEKLSLETKESKDHKNVFAKFKSYNKDVLKTPGITKKNQVTVTNKENPDALLKENANRYTCEGRFSDYNILQKVDKKITDKRLGMSFSEFKKLKIY
jgi:hypothetical protein